MPASLKDAIKACLPPAIWAVARSVAPKYRTYPSWEAAAKAAGTYDDLLLNRFRAARWAGSVDLSDNALSLLLELIPRPLSIVDFGGATGEVGSSLPDGVSYTVVENKTLVGLMAGRGNFTSEMPESCDIFFTSGTLQCLQDPYAVLDRAFGSARRAVVLKRNNFSEREIFRVHRSSLFENGRGTIPAGFQNREISYPFRTVAESRILEIAGRRGLTLIARTPEADGVPIPEDGIYGAQMTFLRRS